MKLGQSQEVAAMCGATALLVMAAVFISGGGIERLNGVLASSHITRNSQTACTWGVFDCYNSSQIYSFTATPNPPPPGSNVTISWTSSPSTYYCTGSIIGSNGYMVTGSGWFLMGPSGSHVYPPISSQTTYALQCNLSDSGVSASPVWYLYVYPMAYTRSTPYISASRTGITRGQSATIYWSTSAGNNYSTAYLFGGGLDGYVSSSGSRSTGAINASTQYGYEVYDSYFGWETPVYVTVGVYNQPVMTTSVTSAAGSATSGGSLTVPFGTRLDVNSTYAAGSGDTLVQSVLNVLPPSPGAEYNANYTTPYNQASRAYSFTPAAPGTYVIKPYITTTYSGGWLNIPAYNVTVTVLPAPPAPAISASPATIDPGATSTLSWSASSLYTTGQCSLTAPSSGATATNFGSIATGDRLSNYYSVNTVVGNWAYSMGGYNGSAYVPTVYRAPASSDLTKASNWSTVGGTIPTSVALFDEPLYISGNLWNFGGVAFTSGGVWSSAICYLPIGTNGTVGSWSCPASLPTGAAQGYSNPVIIGDYIYRFGGYNYTTYAGGVAAVERAPLSSPGSWTNYTNVLPQTLYAHGVAVIGSYVYLFGGYNGSAYLNTIYRASINSDLTLPASWSSGGVIPVPLISMGIATDANYLYLIGGYTSGAATNRIYNIPLSTLAAGGVTQGSWGSWLSLPVARNLPKPLIVNDKLYLMGGWQNGVYANSIYSLPFNDGLAYTSPAITPWRTTGGINQAVTWPLTANTTYTLQCTNTAGSGSDSATVSMNDMCTDITGFQSSLPPGCTGPTPSPSGLCIPAGYMYDGSACVVAPPSIGSFFGPGRVRSGNTAVLKYTVSNPPASCTITGINGFSASVSPEDGVQGSVTTGPITANTVFTLTCASTSLNATVGITPSYQEL